MARIRTVKPEFWVSEQVAECSPNARLTFVGLWNFCDDNGVHPAKPKTLKAELYPMDDFTPGQVAEWMEELIGAGLVMAFHDADARETYWHVTGWSRHQKIDRPSYKYPAPPTNSESARVTAVEHSTSARRAPPPGVESKGVESKGEEDCSLKAHGARRSPQTPMPKDFGISPRVHTWAATKGFGDLDLHLESFRSKSMAKAYRNVDWDEAFMGAIREDWAKVRTVNGHAAASTRTLSEIDWGTIK